MTLRPSLGPLAVGLLSLALLVAAAPTPADSRLQDTTATVVLEAPAADGSERTVVVQLPSATASGAPVLVVRRLDAQSPLATRLPKTGAVLTGRQRAGDPRSLVLEGQTAPTPFSFVLLAIGLGLLLLRQAVLLLLHDPRRRHSG
jgi:hypothetical protein